MRFFYFDETVNDGLVTGPVSAFRLQQLLADGSITQECRICAVGDFDDSGEGNWMTMDEHPLMKLASSSGRLEETAASAKAQSKAAKKRIEWATVNLVLAGILMASVSVIVFFSYDGVYLKTIGLLGAVLFGWSVLGRLILPEDALKKSMEVLGVITAFVLFILFCSFLSIGDLRTPQERTADEAKKLREELQELRKDLKR